MVPAAEADEREGHRQDEAPLPDRAGDLRGDLAVRPGARAAELEGLPDGRRTLQREADAEGDVADVDRLEAALRRCPGTGTKGAGTRTRPATMLKKPSRGPNWSDGLRIVQSSPLARTAASARALLFA